MSNRKINSIVFIFLSLFSNYVIAFEADNAEDYEKGVLLFRQYDGDYSEEAKKGLEAAVVLLEPFLSKKNIKRNLYFMLADSYRNLAIVHYPNGSKDQLALLEKERKVMSLALNSMPNDTGVLMRYAFILEGEASIAIYEKILSIDSSIVEAYSMLAKKLVQKDPAKSILFTKKAYEIANFSEKFEIGKQLLLLLLYHSSKSDYIQFHLRYRNDMVDMENSGTGFDYSKRLKITLELRDDNKPYGKDELFDVVFTNISDKPIQLLNHQKISSDFFKFEGYPETDSDFRFTVPFDDSYHFNSGNRPRYIELQPDDSLILKTSFHEIFSDSFKFNEERIDKQDQGYILVLRYRGAVINGVLDMRYDDYSNAVHINVPDYFK